jgi:hypothetical protein
MSGKGGPRSGLTASKVFFAIAVGLDIGVALHFYGAGAAAIAADDNLGARELLDAVPATTRSGSQVSMTDTLQPIDATVRVDAYDLGMKLDRTVLFCHGGRARITWHVGNLEPTVPQTGIALSIRLDGQIIGSLLRGSVEGIYEDGPASIMAVADCSPGEHELDLAISQITGGWGIPYVANVRRGAVDYLQMNRGFIVMEVW